MKVLFVVSDCTYPPQEGLHQQTLLLVRALQAAGCDVTVVGYVRQEAHLDLEALATDLGLSIDVRRVPSRYPLLGLALANRLGIGRWAAPTADRHICMQRTAGDFDIIHLDGIAACGLYRQTWGLPTVLSFVDPGSRRQLRMARSQRGLVPRFRALVASGLYFLVERSLAHTGTAWHVVSEIDRDYLVWVHRHPETYAIPVLAPMRTDVTQAVVRDRTERAGRTRVLVLGDLRLPHMRSAFERLVTEELRVCPVIVRTCEVVVVGRVSSDPELDKLTDGMSVRFVAWVEDYESQMRAADMIVLPDRVGTGLKNRAVQSLASGTLTIGTSVAFEGLAVEHGVHALVANQDRSLGKSILEVIEADPPLDFSAAATELVRQRHAEVTVADEWLALYRARMQAPLRRPPRWLLAERVRPRLSRTR